MLSRSNSFLMTYLLRRFSLTACLICACAFGYSQDGQQLLNLPGLSASNVYQPAYMTPMGENIWRVGIDFGGNYFSNSIPSAWLNQEDGFIDEAEKTQFLDAFSERSDIWSSVNGQLQIQREWKGNTFSLGYSQGFDLKATIPGGDLPELILNGNAAYQGQTKDGADLVFQNSNTRSLQLGFARAFGPNDQIRWGIMVNPIQGINGTFLDVNQASLYTGPAGDSLFLAADYETFDATSGFGVSLNTGIDWKVNDVLRISAGVNNLGWVNWQGNSRVVNASFGTGGVDAGPLFRDLFPLNDSLFRLDTLNQMFLPDSEAGEFRQNLLPSFFAGLGANLDQIDLFGAVRWQQWLDGRTLPAAFLSGSYSFGRLNDEGPFYKYRIGLNLSSDQWQAFGIGAMGSAAFPVGDTWITVFAVADQLNGYLSPESGTASSVRGGIMIVL